MIDSQSKERTHIEFDNLASVQILFGPHNRHLKQIGRRLGINLDSRGNQVILEGDTASLEQARAILRELYDLIEKGNSITQSEVDAAIDHYANGDAETYSELYDVEAGLVIGGRRVIPKNQAQKRYLAMIRESHVTFGIGPAGTGKTWLAIAAAIEAFLRRDVRRIIVSRPVVEAGEKLGFLPGDLSQKIDPYLRPVYDAFVDLLDFDRLNQMRADGTLEIAPLAYMRGRTLNHAFVLLDEAQNTTSEQMKMFLTRLGAQSRMVINGDITQIDLEKPHQSGLIEAAKVLGDVRGIGMTFFDEKDIIRHKIITDILNAYKKFREKGQ